MKKLEKFYLNIVRGRAGLQGQVPAQVVGLSRALVPNACPSNLEVKTITSSTIYFISSYNMVAIIFFLDLATLSYNLASIKEMKDSIW